MWLERQAFRAYRVAKSCARSRLVPMPGFESPFCPPIYKARRSPKKPIRGTKYRSQWDL